MEVPTPPSVLETLARLRYELQLELAGLAERRSGLEDELEALGHKIEATRRQLELVEATEEQLAAQGRGQRAIEQGGAGGSTQVSGSARLQALSEPVCFA
jgi:phage shock protein A